MYIYIYIYIHISQVGFFGEHNLFCVDVLLSFIARMVLQRPENGGKMCDGDLVVTEAWSEHEGFCCCSGLEFTQIR